MIIIFASLLTVSVIANIALLFKPKSKVTNKKELTKDARDILSDLMTGPALVKIEYIDRSEVLLRSPRDY